MLLDFGWSELMLIGVVALVVIGPKDLPRALRVAGYWVRKARTLSREFQSSVEQMIREAELDEVRDDLKKATEFDIGKEFHNTIDPTGELAEALQPPELPNLSSSSSGAAPADHPTIAEAAAIAPAAAAEHGPAEHAPVEHAPADHAPAEHAPVEPADRAPPPNGNNMPPHP